MMRRLFSTTDELLRPDTLARLLDMAVQTVDVKPFQIRGASTTDSAFVGVHLDGEHEPSLVLKRMRLEKGWVAIVTRDSLGRAATLWQHGVLDRFPSAVDHAVVGCTEAAAGPSQVPFCL
jgi:hypothetical protein